MSPSSSQIEREVEASRANVEETMEALKDKMSMGQIVDEATRYLGDNGGAEVLSKLGAQARANPLPVVLVGVGLAWLMSGRGQPHLPSPRGLMSRHDDDDDADYREGAYDYRRMAGAGEGGVYRGESHQDYMGRSTGPEDAWFRREQKRRKKRGMRRKLGGAMSGVGHVAGGVASGVGTAAGAVASGVGAAASAVTSAASAVASGVGAAASGISSAASSLGSGAAHAGRSAYGAAGALGGGAETALRSGSRVYRGASRSAARFGSDAYDTASRFGSGAYDGASRFGTGARRSFADVLEREPLILAGIGVAVGAAIGALLPRTEAEDRYFGETRDQLRDDAEAYAREQFERGKAVAQEAFEAAKSEAEAYGLTPSTIAGTVGEIARSTMDKVKEGAGEMGLTGDSASQGQGSSGQQSQGGGSQNQGNQSQGQGGTQI